MKRVYYKYIKYGICKCIVFGCNVCWLYHNLIGFAFANQNLHLMQYLFSIVIIKY